MPTKNTSFALSEHFASMADRLVEQGRYGSTSEVIRAGLRLVEEQQERRDRLNALLEEGEASGVAEDFDFDAFIAEIGDEKDDGRIAA